MSTEAPRCSEFARKIGVLPPGTGLFLSRVVLVSVPLPWPKPALNHPIVHGAARALIGSTAPTRLFTAEPDGANCFVEIYERSGSSAAFHRWELTDESEPGEVVERLVTAVAATALGDLATIDVSGADPVDAPTPPTFLICTQGSHDSCCGTSGVALADELVRTRANYRVRRVSHTGGHRFSPTLLAFPEGRMWAYADRDLVDRIATETTTQADHHQHSRGWWGAKVGPAQVAECAVRAERVGQAFSSPTLEQIEAFSGDGQGVARFEVTADGESWHVDVTVGREVPTIACESPGGLPVKPGREFAWSIEQQ